MNIGFFDSGLGGLLVLKAVAKNLPDYDYVYLGDTKHLPYGDKTEEEIFTLTKQALVTLFERDCALVIVACNTASAESMRKLQDTFLPTEYPERRILGVIIPTIEEVIDQASHRAILLATKRTVDSRKYEKELKKLNSNLELVSIATPQLVPLLESHAVAEAIASAIDILETETREGDSIILGCTHYILLKDALRTHFLGSRTILSQDEIIPKKLTDYLWRHPEIQQRLTNTGKREIILTEHRPDYDRLTAEFLGGVYMPKAD